MTVKFSALHSALSKRATQFLKYTNYTTVDTEQWEDHTI